MICNNGILIICCILRVRVEIFIIEECFVSVSNFCVLCNRILRLEWIFV